MIEKKTIAVLYEYFFPGYKAGGPIQSLINMIEVMCNEYNFKIITTAYDLNSTQPYPNIQLNSWNSVILSNNCTIQVWYSSSKKITLSNMQSILQSANANTIFINGLFTQWFTKPLLLHKFGRLGKSKIIISPRGMLQPGALQVKPFKKKIFLALFKAAALFKNIQWHATTTQEVVDIQTTIGKNASAIVAANIPKAPLSNIQASAKQVNYLQLVYLSIITEKKNLLLLLQALKNVTANIQLHIYGPIKENEYWQKCLQQINALPLNIKAIYKGDIEPNKVQNTLQQYNAFISLTKGENFGHALYESFSVGLPVITSMYTPWQHLQQKNAGWNVDINNLDNIVLLLQQISQMPNAQFSVYNNGAWQLAKSYYNNSNFIIDYRKLFA